MTPSRRPKRGQASKLTQSRLTDAFDCFGEGFVLWDADDNLDPLQPQVSRVLRRQRGPHGARQQLRGDPARRRRARPVSGRQGRPGGLGQGRARTPPRSRRQLRAAARRPLAARHQPAHVRRRHRRHPQRHHRTHQARGDPARARDQAALADGQRARRRLSLPRRLDRSPHERRHRADHRLARRRLLRRPPGLAQHPHAPGGPRRHPCRDRPLHRAPRALCGRVSADRPQRQDPLGARSGPSDLRQRRHAAVDRRRPLRHHRAQADGERGPPPADAHDRRHREHRRGVRPVGCRRAAGALQQEIPRAVRPRRHAAGPRPLARRGDPDERRRRPPSGSPPAIPRAGSRSGCGAIARRRATPR